MHHLPSKIHQKGTAFLTALVVTAVGIPQMKMPQTIQSAADNRSITSPDSIMEFMARVRDMKQECPPKVLFSELTFDPERGISCDGSKPLPQCGDFIAHNHSLYYRDSDGKNLTLEEAAKRIGCTYDTDAQGVVTVSSPFQSAQLIVRAEGEIDPAGATDVTEGFGNLHVLQFADAEAAYTAYRTYQNMSGVSLVTPNRYYHVCAEEQSHRFGVPEPSWGYDYVGAESFYKTYLKPLEEKNQLPEIKVAILDTGIFEEHDWFQGRIAAGGASFVEGTLDSYEDQNGHGTHCAGIVCSVTDDNTKILPIQVLDSEGSGDSLGVYCGMLYAAEQNVNVISMSLGGFGEDPLFDEAIQLIEEKDIPICAAAGNESDDADSSSPGRNPYCFTISAIDSDGDCAYFSNYGSLIDFAAPGVDIMSAGLSDTDAREMMSGTSMATPYVAGCCAAVLSVAPEYSVEQLEEVLIANSVDLGEVGFDSFYGYGAINLADFDFQAKRLERPSGSVESGTYEKAFSLELSVETEGAKIYYTTDNTAPSAENGTEYTGSFTISASTIVRAVSYMNGKYSGETRLSYRLGDEDIAHPYRVEGTKLLSYDGVLAELDLTQNADTAAITEVADKAFEGQEGVVSVKLPATVTKLGADAFAGCYDLESLDAEGVTQIGERCFEGCAFLEEFMGFDNLEELPDKAFSECWQLRVSPKNLRKIGEYALQSVTIVTVDASEWSHVTEIEQHGLDGIGLEECKSADFSNVTSLGAYALSSTPFEEITLPQTLNVIPEGLLWGADQLRKLSAPNVTSIQQMGLALCKTSREECSPCETDIDFENKLTSAAAGAFYGFYFADDVKFSALTEQTLDFISGALGSRISLPSVTVMHDVVLPNDDLGIKQPQVFADVLCLENLKSISEDIVNGMEYLVIGNNLNQIDIKLFHSVEMDDYPIFAGPSNTRLATLAEELGYPYETLPYAAISVSDIALCQYEVESVYGYVLDPEMTGKWYLLDEKGNKTATASNNTVLSIDSQNIGTYHYVFEVYQADGTLYQSHPLKVTVIERLIQDPKLEETRIFRIQDGGSYNSDFGEYSATLHFQPDQNMDVCIYVTGGYIVVREGSMIIDFVSAHQTEKKRFALKQGVDYFLDLTSIEPSVVSVLITEDETERKTLDSLCTRLETKENTQYLDAKQLSSEYEELLENVYFWEYDFELDEAVGEEICLTKGKDYDVWTYETEDAVYLAAYGIGEYCGASYLKLPILTALEEDEAFTINCDGDSWFMFTPQKDGMYTFMTMFDEDTFDEGSNQEDRLVAGFKENITITCEENENFFVTSKDGNDIATSQLISLAVDLQAGKTYIIDVEAYFPYCLIHSLTVTRKTNLLSACELSYPSTISSVSDETLEQQITLTAKNNKKLQSGVDYKLYYSEPNDIGDLLILLCGTGSYCGQISFTILLSSYELQEITLEKPFVINEETAGFELHLEEPSLLKFDAEEGRLDLIGSFYDDSEAMYYADENSLVGEYHLTKDSIPLDAGTYQLFVEFTDEMEGQSFTLTAHKTGTLRSIRDVDINFTNIVHSKEEFRVLSITMDGKQLISPDDYSVCFCDEDENMDQIGMHQVMIRGFGEYCGILRIWYLILPNEVENAPVVKEGSNQVTIAEKSDTAFFRWIPTSENALIRDNTLFGTEYTVYNTDGEQVCFDSSISRVEIPMLVTVGETYYICTNYAEHAHTGNYEFTMEYDKVSLDVCAWKSERYQAYTGESLKPSVSFSYQGEPLIEGIDYVLETDANESGIGLAEFTYRGIGRYYGKVAIEYLIYNELAADAEIGILFPSEKAEIESTGMYDEYCFCVTNAEETEQLYRFSYQASDEAWEYYDWEYCSDYPGWDLDTRNYAIFAYDQNREIILDEEETYLFMLAPNETRYFRLITRKYDTDLALTDGFVCVECVTNGAEQILNSVHYVSMNGYAYADNMTDDTLGCIILDEIILDDGRSYQLGGIDGSLLEQLVYGKCIVYGNAGGLAEDICNEHGIPFVPLDEEIIERGDLNGNGCIEATDVRIMFALLSEGDGILLPPAVIARADVNKDGILDLTDVRWIAEHNEAMG